MSFNIFHAILISLGAAAAILLVAVGVRALINLIKDRLDEKKKQRFWDSLAPQTQKELLQLEHQIATALQALTDPVHYSTTSPKDLIEEHKQIEVLVTQHDTIINKFTKN